MPRMSSPFRPATAVAAALMAAVLTGSGLGAGAAMAADALPSPTGEVILTVSGDISASNGDGLARFDLDMLSDLGTRGFTTTTMWTEGDQSFTGVGLDQLLDRLGVEDGMLKATAINDYGVDIPVDVATEGGPIIAFELNGEPMSVRDKGPLWIVFPYDSDPAYRTEITFSQSIWQLDRIEVSE